MAQSTGKIPVLEVRDLQASIGNVHILKGVNLTVYPGETHAIMGPNGSGKSTFAATLAGRPDITVTGGQVLYEGQNLLALTPDKRARAGLFLAFQYPVEIPGVRTNQFLKAAYDAVSEARGKDKLDIRAFNRLLDEKRKVVEIEKDMVMRSLNEGFSGGEKKRNEMLQMVLLEPRLAVLDETDSGLDIDALRIVANAVNLSRTPERAFIMVTHYQRLLDYIRPDYVHVLIDGRIVRSGGPDLARELEAKGYEFIRESLQAGA